MNIRLRYSFHLALLATGLLLLVACGTLEVGVDQDPQAADQATTAVPVDPSTPTATLETAPSPTMSPSDTPAAPEAEEPSPAAAEHEPSPLWATYRDPDSGFGYAFPCHWVHHGSTLVSYDEAYFMNRSIRGQWADGDPPDGAMKLEIAAFDYADSGIEPGTPLEQAVPLAISGDFVASEMVKLGSRDALRVELEGTVFPGDTTNEIYFFQMSPSSMLLFSVLPRSALASPDVQGILESLALAEGEQIVIPAADPNGVLEGREVFADETAGYCFQYPSDYTLEAYPPSGIPYLGEIVTLKLERPFYTLGLTSTALRVGEQSTLEEHVSQFLQGLPEDAQVERNPAERIGGVEFQVGGEPAEFLEGVPGAGGSRDIFAKHEDRLYRLSFIPSTSVNPQAEPDLETLFLVVTTSFSFLPLSG